MYINLLKKKNKTFNDRDIRLEDMNISLKKKRLIRTEFTLVDLNMI